MDKQHKLFNLSKQICEQLEKEPNQSVAVERALKLYFNSKDSAQKVVALAERMEIRYKEVLLTQPKVTIGYENPERKYTYTMQCCITNRPDPSTGIVPCSHWNRMELGYQHFKTGEIIEV